MKKEKKQGTEKKTKKKKKNIKVEEIQQQKGRIQYSQSQY